MKLFLLISSSYLREFCSHTPHPIRSRSIVHPKPQRHKWEIYRLQINYFVNFPFRRNSYSSSASQQSLTDKFIMYYRVRDDEQWWWCGDWWWHDSHQAKKNKEHKKILLYTVLKNVIRKWVPAIYNKKLSKDNFSANKNFMDHHACLLFCKYYLLSPT